MKRLKVIALALSQNEVTERNYRKLSEIIFMSPAEINETTESNRLGAFTKEWLKEISKNYQKLFQIWWRKRWWMSVRPGFWTCGTGWDTATIWKIYFPSGGLIASYVPRQVAVREHTIIIPSYRSQLFKFVVENYGNYENFFLRKIRG